jgi:tetratricopeptide (TPR) repeat protein
MGQETLSLIGEGLEAWLTRPEVNADNVGEWRALSGQLRETTLANPVALLAIPKIREGAERAGLWGDAIELYWEGYLVGKHIFGAAEGCAWAPGALVFRQYGLEIMQRSVKGADKLVREHIADKAVQKTVMRRGRFWGELAMIEGNYKEAIAQYQASIANYETSRVLEERVKGHEIKGFLAEAYIKDGQVERAIATAENAFEELGGEDGLWLDAHTRVVWRSGIVIKACRGLIEQGWSLERVLGETKLVEMLTTAEGELRLHKRLHPEDDLSIRMREIEMINAGWGQAE